MGCGRPGSSGASLARRASTGLPGADSTLILGIPGWGCGVSGIDRLCKLTHIRLYRDPLAEFCVNRAARSFAPESFPNDSPRTRRKAGFVFPLLTSRNACATMWALLDGSG